MIRNLVGLVATPLLAYPLLFVALGAVDTWNGERLLPLYLAHERRLLWDTFWADYAAALPIMYLIAIALVTLHVVLRRARPSRGSLGTEVVLAALAGWSGAIYLSGSWTGVTHVAIGGSSAAFAGALGYFARRVFPAREESS